MNVISLKKLFGFFVGIAMLMSATLAFSRAPYWVRVNDPFVNTRAEARFDHNHNGWVGPWEQTRLSYRRVNHPREFICDFNHNGYIDRAVERACL